VFAACLAAAQLSTVRYLDDLRLIPESNDFKYDYVAARWRADGGALEALDHDAARALTIRLGIHREPFWVGAGHTHPPPATLPVLLLVPLGFQGAVWAWFGLSLAAVYLLAALLLAIWRRSPRLPPARQVAPLALVIAAWPPVVFNLSQGQWSILLATLVAAGWWELARGANRRAALWFGTAMAIKTTPLLLLGYLVLRARRVAAGAVLALAGLALIAWPIAGGLSAWRDFSHRGEAALRQFEAITANTVSVNGIFVRLFLDSDFVRAPFNHPRLAHGLTTAAGLLLVGLAVWVTARRRRPAEPPPDGDRGAAFAAWASLVALLNPLSWTHNAVLLLLPAVLVARDAERPGIRKAVAMALVLLSIPRQTLYGLAGWGTYPFPASRGWILGLHAAGGLVLFAAAVAAAAKRTAPERAPADKPVRW
jgi:hypothetical protein